MAGDRVIRRIVTAALLITAGVMGLLSAGDVAAESVGATVQHVQQHSSKGFVRFDGVSFSYSSSIATAVSGRRAPAQIGGAAPGAPRSIQFTFHGYPRWGGPNSEAREMGALGVFVKIYPIAGFSNPLARVQVRQVRQILRTRPNLANLRMLPFVPGVNAAQVFHVKARYLSFRNGSGISYIGYWTQGLFPLSNDDPVFYTYQGITNDGKYFVSIQLPLHAATLPERMLTGRALDRQSARLRTHWKAYIQRVTRRLNALPGYRYRPSLGSIYAMVGSIHAQPVGLAG